MRNHKLLKSFLSNTWFFPRHIGQKYIRSFILEAKDDAKGITVDIGCGLRPYESFFKDKATTYIGIDLPASPDKALQDITCNALYLPFRSDSIDTILAFELMEHLPDPGKFIEEVSRVLRIGGTLILSVPFLEPIHEEPRDFYRFTQYGLKTLLEQKGFSIKYIKPRGHFWSVIMGSFIPQSLYELANPHDQYGHRPLRVLPSVLVLPLCALFQIFGYALDRIFTQANQYTLGYVIVAFRGM